MFPKLSPRYVQFAVGWAGARPSRAAVVAAVRLWTMPLNRTCFASRTVASPSLSMDTRMAPGLIPMMEKSKFGARPPRIPPVSRESSVFSRVTAATVNARISARLWPSTSQWSITRPEYPGSSRRVAAAKDIHRPSSSTSALLTTFTSVCVAIVERIAPDSILRRLKSTRGFRCLASFRARTLLTGEIASTAVITSFVTLAPSIFVSVSRTSSTSISKNSRSGFTRASANSAWRVPSTSLGSSTK